MGHFFVCLVLVHVLDTCSPFSPIFPLGPKSIVLSMKTTYAIIPISLFLGWKEKAEECDKDIQGWKKKISTATSNISKHNRQIKSKVCCNG